MRMGGTEHPPDLMLVDGLPSPVSQCAEMRTKAFSAARCRDDRKKPLTTITTA